MSLALFPHPLCNIYLIPKLAPFLVNWNDSHKELYSKLFHSSIFWFSDTNWMPYDSIQFNTDYPELVSDAIDLRAQPCKICHFRCQSQVLRPHSEVLMIPPQPHLGLCSESSGKSCIHGYCFIRKDIRQEQPHGRDAQERHWGGSGHRAATPSPGVPPSPYWSKSNLFTIWGVPWTLLWRVLIKVSLHSHDWLYHWPLAIELSL